MKNIHFYDSFMLSQLYVKQKVEWLTPFLLSAHWSLNIIDILHYKLLIYKCFHHVSYWLKSFPLVSMIYSVICYDISTPFEVHIIPLIFKSEKKKCSSTL